MTISAVMMTYNEREYLPLTLPPLRDACDEIIVLDMESTDGTVEYCESALRPTDLIVSYPRQSLFTFGFSHARNYASRFASGEWIFSIDADELLSAVEFRAAIAQAVPGPTVFDLERRNYSRVDGVGLATPEKIVSDSPFTVERHRRLYRSSPRIRFEGLVHEDLWEGDQSAYSGCGSLDLTLHHLSFYRTLMSGENKHELYAYLMLKAQAFPGFRHGTNPWFFESYVPENIEIFLSQANTFAERHSLSPFDIAMLKT